MSEHFPEAANECIRAIEAEVADLRRQLAEAIGRANWNREWVADLQKELAERTPVSFAERLPPNDEKVWVYEKFSGKWRTSYSGGWTTESAEGLSHWLPLPKVETEGR